MKTAVVTGGAGFLGSHLCDALIENHKVICVDNFFTGDAKNVAHLKDHPHFTLVEHDIINPLHLDEPVHLIFNLACPASPIHYQHNAIRTIKANVLGTTNMLGMAKKQGARMLQASTSEVYGDPKEHPQKESYRGNVNPIGIRACYDEGKRCAETLCFDYHRQHGVEVRVARIFNTYGPRMARDDGRVVSNFIVQALTGVPLTIFGTGQQTRSFCYVSDLIAGLIAAMDKEDFTGPVNLGNPIEHTMLELAQTIIDLTGSSSALTHQKLPQDDPLVRRPDITLAKEMLGWAPRTDLQTGLQKTITFFKDAP